MISLSVQKDKLLNQIKQVETLENVLTKYNLTLHKNSMFMFNNCFSLVIDLDNCDQLEITKELTIKIRLSSVDTFIDFNIVQACNEDQKAKIVKDLESIDWDYTLDNLSVIEYAQEIINLENYYRKLVKKGWDNDNF